ncbi:MAG: HxsD-like protein [Polyangiales bacterium]
MRTLRFPKAVYPGEQVDAAVKVYERFGTFERADEDTHWRIDVSASTPEREKRLEGELGNYALGLVVRHGIAAKESAAEEGAAEEGAAKSAEPAVDKEPAEKEEGSS